MEISQRLSRSQYSKSCRHRHTFSFMATSTLLLTFSLILLATLIKPSLALPVTFVPRRNPLTIGLDLRGGGFGVSLGGNSLLNFHHRPRNLDKRAFLEPETQAAENEAVVSSLLEKRAALTGPPTSGVEADSDDTTSGDRPLGDSSHGWYRIGPIDPSKPRPLNSDSVSGSGLEKRQLVENRKRQHTPRNPPGSGSNYNKGDPYSRRTEE